MKKPNYPIEKIVTLESLAAIQQGNSGYIVVTETASPSVVHKPSCPQVSARHFKTKVIDNASKSGNYFWVIDAELGRKAFRASECLICLGPSSKTY